MRPHERNQRKRKTVFIMALLLGGYLLLFPRGTGKELQLQVQWVTSVDGASLPTAAVGQPAGESESAEHAETGGRRWAFRLGDRFGYLDESGALLYAADVLYHVSMTDDRFVNYPDVSRTVVLQGVDGTILSAVDAAGYPLLFGDRMLLLRPDGTTISKWSVDGIREERLWEYSFASVYSAIDVAQDVTLVGDIDGRLVALDATGQQLLYYRSRSGRLPVVAAVALSSDASMAAALMDIDPQRVLLYRRGDEGYTRVAEYELPDSLRRPAPLRFLHEDRYLVWEQPHAVAGVRIDTDSRFVLPLASPVVDFAAVDRHDLLAVVHAGAQNGELVLYNTATRIPAGRLPIQARHVFLRATGDTLLLGLDDRIVAYRFAQG